VPLFLKEKESPLNKSRRHTPKDELSNGNILYVADTNQKAQPALQANDASEDSREAFLKKMKDNFMHGSRQTLKLW